MKKLLLTVFSVVCLSFLVTAEAKTITLNEDNLLTLEEDFNPSSVAKIQIKARELCPKYMNKDLYLYLDSPGGSVMAGMSMISSLKGLSCKIHTITESAASMGYQTVQHLGNRYILPHGYLMSHRAQLGGLGGQIPGELDSRMGFYKSLLNGVDRVTAARVGMSLIDYKELIHDELWLVGQDAVDSGHADEVINVFCDKSLNGTRIKNYQTPFGEFRAEFSTCPTIRAPLNVKGLNGALVEDFFKSVYNKKALVEI